MWCHTCPQVLAPQEEDMELVQSAQPIEASPGKALCKKVFQACNTVLLVHSSDADTRTVPMLYRVAGWLVALGANGEDGTCLITPSTD
jgi:hypothetical protein